MKRKFTFLVLFALIISMLASCDLFVGKNQGSNSENDPSMGSHSQDTKNASASSAESHTQGSDIGQSASDTGQKQVLDNQNISRLFSMNLGEVIAALGSTHSEPLFFEGSICIGYENSCYIFYERDYAHDNEPRIKPEAKIIGIKILQRLDVHKGISVGKSLDNINGNPDLKNKLVSEISSLDGSIIAVGYYKVDDIYITVGLTFDENMICTEIFLKQEKTTDYLEYLVEI